MHYTTSCNTQSSAPEDGQINSLIPTSATRAAHTRTKSLYMRSHRRMNNINVSILFSNFRLVSIVIFSFLGNSPAGELPKKEHNYIFPPPGNYPERNILHIPPPGNYPTRNMLHIPPPTGELPKKEHITYSPVGELPKKEHITYSRAGELPKKEHITYSPAGELP